MFNGLSMTFNPVLAALMSARIVPSFNPLTLFAAGEPGVWYDPSDFSTMFQDAAGTTPVTAVEQPVGLILDKSKGLVLGPELVVNGGFDADLSGWTTSAWVYRAGNAYLNTGTVFQSITQIAPMVVGRSYRISYNYQVVSGSIQMVFNSQSTPDTVKGVGTGTSSFIFTLVDARAAEFAIRNNIGATEAYIDNISIRELPGNHAYQTTATSRPVLSARYNLLTKTERFDDAVWQKTVSSGTLTVIANNQTAPDGTTTADTIQSTAASNARLQQANPSIVGASYRASIWVKHISGTNTFAMFDANSNTIVNYTATSDWVLYTLDFTASSTSGGYFVRFVQMPADGAFAVWGASLVQTDQSHLPYQRVNTATDYDSDPAKFKPYLRFDGIDDWLVTNTITPGIDKAQVFAGVRKLRVAAEIIAETGASSEFAGAFYFVAESASNRYGYAGRGARVGVAADQVSLNFFPPPDTAVLTATQDINGNTPSRMRRNAGAWSNSINTTFGGGNFLAYPMYIGRRGGTTLPFNGHLYSLIVRFGNNLPIETIEKTEKYVGIKTGVTL